MTTWSNHELERIGNAQELRLASARADGSLRAYTTMWVVRVGDEIYVRSAAVPSARGIDTPRPAVPVASAPAASNAT
jgi:hypothetical protein